MERTFIKRLDADTDNFQKGMIGNPQSHIFVIGGGHPEGQPSSIDKHGGRELEQISKHSFEAVRFLWRDVLVLSVFLSDILLSSI